ncbi:phage tail-like protein [Kribbella amoyensis]|uniref:Phage tail-like protein n=1 Tax=Kribbella amoyensis TaxID=996641 RepID=A0A561BKK2_9ACTN|nr:phage tail protein [Kribbella amoyensis]TWD79391.1 phage tail-like protein [Kribbella amoyensis]
MMPMPSSAKLGMPGQGLEQLTGQVGMSHRYVIEIDRSEYRLGAWTKAAGLGVRWQKLSYRPGYATFETIAPGNISYTDVSLSRAAGPASATVQRWLASVTLRRTPLSGAIYLVDFLGMPVVTWELREFFPISWRLTEFDSTGSRPAVETLDLAHNGFLNTDAVLP